jgi:PEP-CTERM motif-containing protein
MHRNTSALLITAAFVSLSFAVLPAQATILSEDFTFTGSVLSASGQFAYDTTNNMVLTFSGSVSSGSSPLNNGPITGLVTSGSPFAPTGGNFYTYSNTFDPASQTFDGDGLLFAFGAGNYGEFYNNPGVFLSTWLPDGPPQPPGPLFIPGDAGPLQVAASVPEPSTWAMMILGFVGVGFMAYRRTPKLSFTAA